MRSFTRPPRRRMVRLRLMVATLLGGAVVGAASPALADPSATVTFHGGCGVLGVGGSSMPDVAEVTVPSGSEVAFRNGLSRPAVLRLDGQAVAEVAPDDTARVWFGSGRVSVTMEILCLVGQPVGAVVVSVVPAAKKSPSRDARSGAASTPRPPTAPRSRVTPGPPAADSPVDAADPRPGRPSGPASTPSPWAGSPTPSAPAVDELATPTPSPTLEVDGAGPVTARDVGGGSAEIVDPGAASRSLTGGNAPTGGDGSIGLLALIATVCVVGVSAGAVRTIITQRANRAEWA